MDFSMRLKELRTEKGYTQRELATLLSLSPNSICEWEKGRCQPSIECLKTLCELLECSSDYLLGQSDDFGNITISAPLTSSLPTNEQALLQNYRKLPADLQHRATAYMEKLVELSTEETKTTFTPATTQAKKVAIKK